MPVIPDSFYRATLVSNMDYLRLAALPVSPYSDYSDYNPGESNDSKTLSATDQSERRVAAPPTPAPRTEQIALADGFHAAHNKLLDTLMESEEFELASYWMALRALAEDKPEYTAQCFRCAAAFEDTLGGPRAETIKRFRVHLRVARGICTAW